VQVRLDVRSCFASRRLSAGCGSVLMVNVAGVALVVASPDGVAAITDAVCCCGVRTCDHGGAAERDAVASMEVGRGYGSLQVARWLTANICRFGSLMVLARAWCRCVEEDGGGCYVSPARMVGFSSILTRGRNGTLWLWFI